MLAERKLLIDYPGVRRTGGSGEVALETYSRLQPPTPCPELCSAVWFVV
jgi:hypothetical protein